MAEKKTQEAVAKKPISYTLKMPEGIQVALEGKSTIVLKSAKGELKRNFSNYRVQLEVDGNKIYVSGTPITRKTLDMVKSASAHMQKMAEGLLYGYKYQLKIVYSHFPMTTQLDKDKVLIKNFLGEKFPRSARIMGKTKVETKGADITVTGINLEEVSQTASNIEQAARIKDKDIRRYQDGIYLTEATTMADKPAGNVVEVLRGRQ